MTQSEAVSVPEPKPRVLTQNPQVLLPQTPVTDNSQHQRNVVRKNTPHVAVQSTVAMQPGIAVHQAIAGATPVMASSAPVTGKKTRVCGAEMFGVYDNQHFCKHRWK